VANHLVGTILGPYEIIDFVGYSGMAEVYRGHHPELERTVTVKVVGRHMSADPVFNARFRREAKAVAQLRHPNIVQVYDFGEIGGGHYLVMDDIEGPTLADLLAHHRLDTDDILFIFRQIASALTHAHEQEVVHRDVHPGNVIITRNRQAFLANFGMALLLSRQMESETGNPGFGIAEYLAPEQLADSRIATPAADIYSLGVILYEMLTGERPFNAEDAVDIALRHFNETAPDPRFLDPDIPASVAKVTLKALNKNPKERFGSAMQLANALEQAWRPEPRRSPARQPEKPQPPVEPPPVKRGPTKAEERRAKRKARQEQQQRERRARLAEKKRQQQAQQRAAEHDREATRTERLREATGQDKPIAPARRRGRRRRTGQWLGLAIILVVTVAVCLAGLLILQSFGVITLFASPATLTPAPATATPSPPPLTPTTFPIPTPLQPVEATPIPPLPVVPLEVGTQALRIPDGMVMQFVPEGSFPMGTDDGYRDPQERPQHTVMLSDFWIDQTEVTNAQFRLCVDDGLCQPPTQTRLYDDPFYADYPVTFVPYEGAVAYCLWVAGETGLVSGLPSEAQWEKAASWDPITGAKRTYPWGEADPSSELLRYSGAYSPYPAAPVGSYPAGASAYGALDMAGNVWEWVADWYDRTYYEATGIMVNPTGPVSGQYRVTRGGSWGHDAVFAVTTFRNPTLPDTASGGIGFRCAVNAGRPPSGSNIAFTSLEAVETLLDWLDAARSDPTNTPAELNAWTDTLTALQSALQNDEDAIARTLIEGALVQLQDEPQLDEALTFRMTRTLTWMLTDLED
jgi:formylglycine-generating enzyme required for sulfatase activity